MEKIILSPALESVTRLGIGSLGVTPPGSVLDERTLDAGAEVLAYALKRGLNFIDTAQYYANYEVIRRGGIRAGVFDFSVSSKTYAHDRKGAVEAVEEARRALDRDVIDLFMLHEQESLSTLRGHSEALDALLALKKQGIIRAVGVSTHRVGCAEAVCELCYPNRDGSFGIEDRDRREERPFDVLFPIINRSGLGISDGSTDEMLAACRRAKAEGLGIMAMKALGGGNFYASAAENLRWVLDREEPDVVMLGMRSEAEVDADIAFFETGAFPAGAEEKIAAEGRRLVVEEDCVGCGACARRCGQGAMKILDGKAVPDPRKCVLCGYCAPVCPHFAIKIV